MSIRLHKLASEVGAEVSDVVARLQGLGWPRYKGPQDQVADDAAAALRRACAEAARRGGTPRRPPDLPVRAPAPPPPSGDLMAALVPGVAPLKDGAKRAPVAQPRRTSPVTAPVAAAPLPPAPSTVADGEMATLRAEVVALRGEVAALLADARATHLALEALDADRALLRAELDRRVGASAPAAGAVASVSDRPVGDDRAVGATVSEQLLLAGHRRLRVVGATVSELRGLRALLDRRIVLTDGSADDGSGVVVLLRGAEAEVGRGQRIASGADDVVALVADLLKALE